MVGGDAEDALAQRLRPSVSGNVFTGHFRPARGDGSQLDSTICPQQARRVTQ